MDARSTLLAAAALHLGFQLVVTVLVYPALAATPPRGFPAAHTAHSRRITPVVAVVHGCVLAAWIRIATSVPPSPHLGVALAGTVLTGMTTAVAAAPTHARIGREGPRPALLARLRRADAVRLAGAVLTVAGALG